MKVPMLRELDNEVEDRARFAAMTPKARLKLFLELCDLTDALQAGRPNQPALRAAVPISEEAAALLTRLRRGVARER